MATTIYDPENEWPIVELWAYISVDENGNEGLCAWNTAYGNMPAMSSQRRIMEMAKDQIRELAAMTEKKIKLVRFIGREDIEIIEPKRGA